MMILLFEMFIELIFIGMDYVINMMMYFVIITYRT